MKYKVLKSFKDAEDELKLYGIGGEYPRKDFEPSDDRIDKLIGLGYIEDVKLAEDVEEIDEKPEEDESGKITEANTKMEIMAFLDDLGVDYVKNSNKKELLALLDDYDGTND